MVAEAIRQSEIEAKKEQQKQNRKESKKGENGAFFEKSNACHKDIKLPSQVSRH